MNGKADPILVQYDLRELLRSHSLIGVGFNIEIIHFHTGLEILNTHNWFLSKNIGLQDIPFFDLSF